MRNYKKYLAAALAATMVVGSSVVAEAKSYVSDTNADVLTSSNGTITGNGQMEGKVDQDVFHVVVPTSIQGTNTNFTAFNFVLDPQKLITQTDGERYTTGSNAIADTFESGKTLYFVNKTDRKLDNTSDYVLVTNKSSIDVGITLNAEMKGLTDITLSDTATFADDATSMYMAVIGGTDTKAITKDGAEVTGKMEKAKPGAYDTVYDAGTTSYSYKLVNDEASLFDTYEFALTGASNENGDWLNVSDTPSVELTWKVEPYEEPEVVEAAPSIATTTYAKPASGDLEIAVDLGTGDLAATGIESITFMNGTNEQTVKDTNYELTDGKLILKSNLFGNLSANRTYTITFNDTAKTEVEVTVTI